MGDNTTNLIDGTDEKLNEERRWIEKSKKERKQRSQARLTLKRKNIVINRAGSNAIPTITRMSSNALASQ
jgi:hypothetical protein